MQLGYRIFGSAITYLHCLPPKYSRNLEVLSLYKLYFVILFSTKRVKHSALQLGHGHWHTNLVSHFTRVNTNNFWNTEIWEWWEPLKREMFQFDFGFDQLMVTGRLILPIDSEEERTVLMSNPSRKHWLPCRGLESKEGVAGWLKPL